MATLANVTLSNVEFVVFNMLGDEKVWFLFTSADAASITEVLQVNLGKKNRIYSSSSAVLAWAAKPPCRRPNSAALTCCTPQQPGSVSRAVTDIPGPAFLSHTVGIAVALHVCAGVQITLSVSLRLSKEQDVNAARRRRREAWWHRAFWERSSLGRWLEQRGFYSAFMHEKIWLRLRVCGTDFDVYIFAVHTYSHRFSFGKYKLELQWRANSKICATLLEYRACRR